MIRFLDLAHKELVECLLIRLILLFGFEERLDVPNFLCTMLMFHHWVILNNDSLALVYPGLHILDVLVCSIKQGLFLIYIFKETE